MAPRRNKDEEGNQPCRQTDRGEIGRSRLINICISEVGMAHACDMAGRRRLVIDSRFSLSVGNADIEEDTDWRGRGRGERGGGGGERTADRRSVGDGRTASLGRADILLY